MFRESDLSNSTMQSNIMLICQQDTEVSSEKCYSPPGFEDCCWWFSFHQIPDIPEVLTA